jgi:hypothetical protein
MPGWVLGIFRENILSNTGYGNDTILLAKFRLSFCTPDEQVRARRRNREINPTRLESRSGSMENCRLHPLIHTLLKFALAQDLEKKKAEPKLRPKARSLFLKGLAHDSI